LFTENTLTVILPLLLRKDVVTFVRVLRLRSIVLCANFVGTYLFALAIGHVVLFPAPVHQAFTAIALAYLGPSFGIIFTRAIFAGWLIALMVWLLPGAESARVSIITIIIITYLVGLGGLNHIIAGSTTMLYLVVTHAISWGTYFTGFFFPTILGGVSLVAAPGHAQVVGGKE
jgi:formate-nitrite transporter family protein